jgi:hypothetical protein
VSRFGTIVKSIAEFVRGVPLRGYIYVPRDNPGLLAEAAPGRVVRVTGDRPPWIVVDKTLERVSAHPWPGLLWRVEVTQHTSADDLLRLRAYRLAPDAGFVRAATVTVLDQVPVATLFGAHGAKVCAVIDAAGELTPKRAMQVAGARHPQAGEAYTRAWHIWLAREHPNFIADNRAGRDVYAVAPRSEWPDRTEATEFDGALDIGKFSRSPVGAGLGVVSDVATRRAEDAMGKSIWTPDPVDPEEDFLAEPWPSAIRALLDATLALGAPDLVPDADRSILLKAWREVIGAEPA